MGELDGRVVDHVDRHAQRGPARALADAGLQHPELALVDGELGVAHVAVVRLEPGEDVHQLGVDGRELGFERTQRLGVADAGHDVLALGVDEEVAIGALCARGGIAREADAGAGLVVAVAEHHGLHVHGRAEVVRDVLALTVGDGSRPVPGGEDGLDGAAELVDGLLGERVAGLGRHDAFQLFDKGLQVACDELGVRGTGALLERFQGPVQLLPRDAEDDATVHLHETAVGVEGEPLVAGLLGKAFDGAVVEAEVQDGVHHPRHGELRARADRDEQRVVRVTEAAAHAGLELCQVLADLCVEPVRPACAHVGAAGVGRDREAVRHRQAEHRGHLGQVGAFPTEQILELHGSTGVLVVEVVDIAHEGLLEIVGTRSLNAHRVTAQNGGLGRFAQSRARLPAGELRCRGGRGGG